MQNESETTLEINKNSLVPHIITNDVEKQTKEQAMVQLNEEFNYLIEEADRIKVEMANAKTSLKREYYKKKLEKLKKKTYKSLLNRAIADPQLLKRAGGIDV